MIPRPITLIFFFFNDTATTEIYTLSLHDALPISIPAAVLLLVGIAMPVAEMVPLHPYEYTDFNADRKSTRLNSSHDQISYAVFCLKKKKKNYAASPQTDHRESPLPELHRHSDDSP